MSTPAFSQHRSRSRKSPTISLFPFLAVLICTMGALVPLLLAMARQARLQALHEATVKAAQCQVDAQSQRELTEWRIGELKTARSQAEERLTQARLVLGHVENHARRLRQQGDQLQATLRGMDHSSEQGTQDRTELEAQWRQIQEEIAEAEKQLAAAQQAAAARPRSYAIIPYQGPNGTYRPPLYIECRADAIVLQPEGIALRETDFEEPIEADNPLDQALRAAREALLAQKQIRGDGSDEPYPLLLVRPNGIPAYYVARAALASWKSSMGYELVGEDWELAFPQSNPEVDRAMRAVVAEAREQRRRRAVLTAMLANSTSPGAWSVAMGGGPVAGQGSGVAIANGSPSDAAQPAGQATAFAPERFRSADSQPSRDARGGTVAGEPTGVSGLGSAGSGASDSSGQSLTSQFGGGESDRGPASAVAENVSQPGRSVNARGLAAEGAMASAVFGNAKAASRESRVSYRAAPGGGLIREIDPDTSSSAALLRRGAVKSSAGAKGDARSAVEGRRIASSDQGSPAGTASQAGGAPAIAMRPGEWLPQENPPPEAKQNPSERSDPHDAKTKRLAESRGENWGLPNAARGSVGVTRPIRVRCTSNRLEIVPDDPKAERKFVALGERVEDTIDDFVSAVWEYMNTWGIAGRGMYWRPILRIEVTPDAEFRFDELKTLLDNSGLIVERKS